MGQREMPAPEEAGDKQLPTYQLLTVDESRVSGASGYSSVKNRVAIPPDKSTSRIKCASAPILYQLCNPKQQQLK